MSKNITQHELAACIDCGCFNIRKAARRVTQHFEEVMHPIGLRATQFSILAMLAGAGPLTITALADRLVMDRTTLTRNLKPLTQQQLATTAPGVDRRTRTVSITEQGRTKLAKALPLWRQAQADMIGYLGKARFQHLLGELRFLENLAPPA